MLRVIVQKIRLPLLKQTTRLLCDMSAYCYKPYDCLYPVCSCHDIETSSGFISMPSIKTRHNADIHTPDALKDDKKTSDLDTTP